MQLVKNKYSSFYGLMFVISFLVINTKFAASQKTNEGLIDNIKLQQEIKLQPINNGDISELNNPISNNQYYSLLTQNQEIKLEDLKFIYPDNIDPLIKSEVNILLDKIKRLCPDCSNGVTIGSTVIRGGSLSRGVYRPSLFPNISGDSITISKREYGEFLYLKSLYNSK